MSNARWTARDLAVLFNVKVTDILRVVTQEPVVEAVAVLFGRWYDSAAAMEIKKRLNLIDNEEIKR